MANLIASNWRITWSRQAVVKALSSSPSFLNHNTSTRQFSISSESASASVPGRLAEQLDSIGIRSFQGNDVSRVEVAMAARKLFHKLETKEEKTLRLAIEETIDIGVFETWVDLGGKERDVEELARMTSKDVDPKLLRQQLRLMAANHIVEEVGEDRYLPTDYSLAVGSRATRVAPALRIRTDHVAQCCAHWPAFLAATNYCKPVDDKKSCYIDAFPEKKSFFERCRSNPAHQESFSSFMILWSNQKRLWPQFYDTEALLQGADLTDGSTFVVDVGGHHGVDLFRVLDRHPNIPAGSLVLEDLPEVIASVNITTDKIRTVPYNFFEEGRQPVEGSRAYYMHAVLHDWSDQSSIDILKQIAAVMKPGYSKVLINDIVIPVTGTSCYQAALDCLVVQASANERTEAVWREVIHKAGLKLVRIWPDGRGYESIIEAELP